MRTEPSAGRCCAQPVLVVALAGRGADQPVAIGAQIRERHLGDDAATLGEKVIQRRATGRGTVPATM